MIRLRARVRPDRAAQLGRSHPRLLPLLAVGIVMLGALPACSAGDARTPDTAVSGEVTVAAASSLTGTLDEVARRFEAVYGAVRVRVSYAGSDVLAEQIGSGAPFDVFAAANGYAMADVIMAGRAADPVAFATNQLAVVAPSANPGDIGSWRDVARPGVRVAMCVRQAPCGLAALTLLDRAKLQVVAPTTEPDVRAVLARTIAGRADAGIVYVTDAKGASSQVQSFSIPDGENVSTTYEIAALTDARNQNAAAAFAAFVSGNPEAQQLLRDAGFGSAPSPSEEP